MKNFPARIVDKIKLLASLFVLGLFVVLISCSEDSKPLAIEAMIGTYDYEIYTGPLGDADARIVDTGKLKVELQDDQVIIYLNKDTPRELEFKMGEPILNEQSGRIGINFDAFNTVDQSGTELSISGFPFYKAGELAYPCVFWGESEIVWMTFLSDYENDQLDFYNFLVAVP